MSIAAADQTQHDPSSKGIGVETLGVTKRFGSLVALDDVSIKVRPGSFHALLGGERRGQVDAREMHHGRL